MPIALNPVNAPASTLSGAMRRCLDLASRGIGAVSPNPLVGAVLLAPDGTLLGEGFHSRYGGPHAEVNAVADAESRYGTSVLRSATLVVNLEPCSHFGKTPPCSDLIITRGIPRVVIGMRDPNPIVDGKGITRLRQAGVEVLCGVLEPECLRLNEAYVHHLRTGRPLVTVKIAQTLDGRVTLPSPDERWISGPESRTLVHAWRASNDAVLVGSGTALADDPALSVRHAPGRQPVRIVLDRTGALPPHLQLFGDEFASKTIAVVGSTRRPAYEAALLERGGRVMRVPETDGRLNLSDLLSDLGRAETVRPLPIQSLLVEPGPALASALFDLDLVDRFFVFIAPKLGCGGLPVFCDPSLPGRVTTESFAETSWELVGDDLLFSGYRRTLYTS